MNINIITASKRTETISEAPAIISVITSLQIRQRGYRTVAEALESLPGIDILNDHLQYNAGIRGINSGMRAWSRIVKVMIDNQPVYCELMKFRTYTPGCPALWLPGIYTG